MSRPPVVRLLAVAALLSIGSARAEDEYPRVSFIYRSAPFDRECAGWLKAEIKPEWVEQARAKVKLLQAEWDGQAPQLLGTTVKEIGRPFAHLEEVATLTLCPIPSMSRPLIVNMRSFIDGLKGNWPPSHFPAVVFHELLHNYTSDIIGRQSPLLKKYEAEPISVRGHLHVAAVMKLVYLKLGRTTELSDVIAVESALPSPVYARTWEIINKIEGHMPFVNELKRH